MNQTEIDGLISKIVTYVDDPSMTVECKNWTGNLTNAYLRDAVGKGITSNNSSDEHFIFIFTMFAKYEPASNLEKASLKAPIRWLLERGQALFISMIDNSGTFNLTAILVMALKKIQPN